MLVNRCNPPHVTMLLVVPKNLILVHGKVGWPGAPGEVGPGRSTDTTTVSEGRDESVHDSRRLRAISATRRRGSE